MRYGSTRGRRVMARLVAWGLICSAGAGLPFEATAAAGHKQAHRTKHEARHDGAGHASNRHAAKAKRNATSTKTARGKSTRGDVSVAKPAASPTTPPAPVAPTLTGDLATLKETLNLARKGKIADATALKGTIDDGLARTVAEWLILRNGGDEINFARYAAFISEHPAWPSLRSFRARAEARLWHARSDGAVVRNFIDGTPASVLGRLALARSLLAMGDKAGATAQVREAWRTQPMSERLETDALDSFREILTADDHRARMDRRIGARDFAAAMRAARRLGADDIALVKACIAVAGNAKNALGLLDQVGGTAREDLGFALCRAQALMRHDRFLDAARVMLAASPRTMADQDADEWWRQRRVLARKLLDLGESEAAYKVVRDTAMPANPNYRAEAHFMAGWIALRFRNDAATARAHFAHIDDGSRNPIVLARANYWRARAAEALGDTQAMRAGFEAAAAHPTAYYGQLARAKLGLAGFTLRQPRLPESAEGPSAADELAGAADKLYAIGETDQALAFAADLAERSDDVRTLIALGDLARRRHDARTMLQIGKTALARGFALDSYAFPDIGVPEHLQPIGPPVERSLIFSVARTESAFDQKDVSPARAVGLMQVTPEAGRDTARRFGVTYDWNRLVSDPVYNTQMGAAELAALMKEYGGCHIMTFAGYNAGRGRVQQWVRQYGDPRRADVDAVDWVERIPFAETRNYVQRVTENLAVYRVRLQTAPSTPLPVTASASTSD